MDLVHIVAIKKISVSRCVSVHRRRRSPTLVGFPLRAGAARNVREGVLAALRGSANLFVSHVLVFRIS